MKIDASSARNCLKSFDFATLFREHLGWDNHHARLEIPSGDTTFVLNAIAQKRGFVAFLCPEIPDRPTRLKIDHKVTKSVREHFVIYTDQSIGRQVWHWVRREPGKPLASRDHRFEIDQTGDPLIQRLDQIAVSMEEEETVTVVDIAGRVRAALDVDKITKRFYDRFKAEHAAFLKLVKGIKTDSDLAWYTSLMLNRLMFVYFIQKKGFLDSDTDYLRNRLIMVQKLRGKDRFQTFYRFFLLRLFHEGLGRSPDERKLDLAMEKLLGRIPFLNGGFFEVHQLEEQYPDIDIPDKAFEKLFTFFDQYRWHLDERPLRADNEINPDVVGYIFEKYINQKQMGAYYTKEDITEYISKNTIIPFVFDAAEKKYPEAFKPDGTPWKLLREDPDRYIYPAVKHGVVQDDGAIVSETELPDFVQTGMHDPKARMHDNQYNLQQAPVGDPIRLVTETWREYGSRRSRCLEIREKLKKGEIHHISDLITLNMDLWQFARDTIINSEGPELLRAFWQAIEKVTVLDPTCGSGAFLFAALRILETLYSDCLERMARFIEDMENKPHHPKQFSDFKNVLAHISRHPNERYFILKSIILNNLYGVDIMAEAVEICKLRLFLKLVSQVERVEQIEPLPDMDFNIRTGNTLVGYATAEQVSNGFTHDTSGQGKLMFGEVNDAYRRFEENLLVVEKAFKQFRTQQTTHGGGVTIQDKQVLRSRLEKLGGELDCNLAYEYSLSISSYKTKTAFNEAFDKWKNSHQPFHWFVEFYGIMHGGGFDVVIGNPPFVEYSQVTKNYRIRGYATKNCGNLYAFIFERCTTLLRRNGRSGLIMPLSGFSTSRMQPLQKLCREYWGSNCVSFLSGDANPSRLFDGVKFRLSIVLSELKPGEFRYFATKYIRWYTEERTILFPHFHYYEGTEHILPTTFPKLGNRGVKGVLNKVRGKTMLGSHTVHRGDLLYYHNCPVNWIRATTFMPRFWSERDGDKISTQIRTLSFRTAIERDTACCVINSSVFFLNWLLHSDCYHLVARELLEFPICIDGLAIEKGEVFQKLCKQLMNDYQKHSKQRVYFYKTTGKVVYDEFYPKLSKPIIDEIDTVLAEHYGFTDMELDFIINYDIKYRLGRESGN
ncbi:Eco57I restriction-modification methylase domain-containing protein [Thermodesulfobacteriota bacterium]